MHLPFKRWRKILGIPKIKSRGTSSEGKNFKEICSGESMKKDLRNELPNFESQESAVLKLIETLKDLNHNDIISDTRLMFIQCTEEYG
jgi:hypothetical protein